MLKDRPYGRYHEDALRSRGLMHDRNPWIPAADEVLFVPLGGVGEIGMNLSLYGHDGEWLMIDLGITFGGDNFPNYEVMTPDPAFIEQRRDRLVGLILTHAHEDHLGAITHLWRRLRCPIYATPFTAAVLDYKLGRAGLAGEVPVNVMPLGARFAVGGFEVEYITLTHSIPEPNAVLIRTAAGSVYHSGDWKLDDDPTIGLPYDKARLIALGREPMLAMVSDSTNAVVPGRSGSEGALLEHILPLVEDCSGRLLVTCFASNIARLGTIARAAHESGRRLGILGQSMQRMLAIARAIGYWDMSLPEEIEPRDIGYFPPAEVVVACTGSQGEPRAALARLASHTHPDLMLDVGDEVVFSSRLIPGNEISVHRVQENLRAIGVRVLTDEDEPIHVSGHPARDELARLYDWLKPPVVIPAHGTPRHLAANAEVAAERHVPLRLVGSNGNIFRLGAGGGEIVGRVETGRLVVRNGYCEPVPPAVVAKMYAAAR